MFTFEIHADFKAIIDMFAKDLSPEIIRKELANALNKGVRDSDKEIRRFAADKYNMGKEVLTKEGKIRTRRARADKDQMEAGVFVSSKPVSLRTFMVANKPVAVFVRSRATMPEAFLVNTSDNSKAAGIFMRDKVKAAYAPTKGAYKGRIVTRGPNKGRLMKRQAIDKKFTLTTAQVANAGSEGALAKADVVADFEARLDKALAKIREAKAV